MYLNETGKRRNLESTEKQRKANKKSSRGAQLPLQRRAHVPLAMLKVVRFPGSGARESHELALCRQTDTPDSTTLEYSDRSVECATELLVKAVDVNVDTMLSKDYVYSTVLRDARALREQMCGRCDSVSRHSRRVIRGRVPDVRVSASRFFCVALQVFVMLDDHLSQVREAKSAQQCSVRRCVRSVPSGATKVLAKDMLIRFTEDVPMANVRLHNMGKAIKLFSDSSQSLTPTRCIATALHIDGLQLIDLSDGRTLKQVRAYSLSPSMSPASTPCLDLSTSCRAGVSAL